MKKVLIIEPSTLTPDCSHRGCIEQPYMIVDRSKPPVRYMDNGREWDKENDKRKLTSTISYSSVPHESGLCYFHLKTSEGYFTAHYPLQVMFSPLGEGGLSKCPVSIISWKKKSVRLGRWPGL